ncbi:hypothetical protein HMPREF1624_00205 [Sporothrix schenckii ATCC 58251]|uniref:peptidylprolyl isomerase n=1 Tax=Sporothrix schenckii (strain ATCC 58251 / de Perez 2211183) TaxID=1391915 RepID=U7Q4J6_SPOS1|nr:hypothetical protein HMPREF1624_00205 [Sporothrix schenckii ATCC 58251]
MNRRGLLVQQPGRRSSGPSANRASSTPSSSSTQQLTRLAPDDLPPHQTLELPLSEASVRKIAEIGNRSASLRVYETHLKKSAELLREAVGNVNETLAERIAQLEATAERRRERGGDKPGEGEAALMESVARLKESVGDLTAQVERGARTTIDRQMELEDERQALTAMASRIEARYREDKQRKQQQEQEREARAAEGGSRSRRRRRKRRRTDDGTKQENSNDDNGGDEGDSGEDDDDNDNDDDDEDIANTYQGPPAASALSILREERAIRAAAYAEMTAHQKYGLNNDYIAFKQMLHVSMYPDDDVQLPDASQWFDAAGEPAPYGPGAGSGAGDSGDEVGGDNDDDDLVVQREVISFKCPLSLVVMQDPYRSNVCKHSFEHSAIMEYLRPTGSSRSAAHVPKKCPQTGCTKEFTALDLVPDTTMRRRIQQAAKRERRRRDAAEAATSDAEGDGHGDADNGPEHAQDVDDIVDASQLRRMTKAESEARSVKRERFQRTH